MSPVRSKARRRVVTINPAKLSQRSIRRIALTYAAGYVNSEGTYKMDWATQDVLALLQHVRFLDATHKGKQEPKNT